MKPWERDYTEPDFSKAKPNNIFSTDGLNTNAPQRADSWWQSVKNAYNEHMNEHWAEVYRRTEKREKAVDNALTFGETVGKSAASAFVDLYGSAGSMINWFGDNMIISDENAELLGLEKKTQDRLNTFGKVWQTAGSSIRAFADYTKANELKLNDKIFEGEIWENPSANRFGALYGSVVPSMVSMAGLSKLTGSKAFTYITMGGLSSGEIYEEAKKKGLDLERTNLLYTSSWASQSLLERLFDPIANVFDAKVLGNSIPKQMAKRVFSGMMESGTEFSQTFSQNAIKKYGGIDETQDLMEGVIESMIGGFIGGGVFSGAFNERNQALLDKGMSQDEINAVIDEAGRYVSGHADEINDFAFQKITEGLSTFEEFIKTHAGTPEAQKAIQTKKDLEFVGEQVYDMLKKAGRTEEIARKSSQIIQGISLWGAEETGLSPLEFFKQRFPEVRQANFKDFQEQFAQKKQRADLKNVNLFEAVLNPKMREEIAKAEKAERGLSLIQFIKQRGGLKDVDGDLKAMDAGKMQIGLINNKGGNELDDIALAAWENGYFPDKMERPDIDELKSAIRDELFGEKKYAFQQGKESVLKDIEELEAALDMLDIDYSNMSASELEAVYNEAVNEYNASNKVTFDEDEYIDDEDYIPFQGGESENVVDLSSLFEGMKDLTVKQAQNKIIKEFETLLGKPLKTGTPPYKLQLVKGKHLHVVDNGFKMTPAQNRRKLSTLSVIEDVVSNAVKIDKDGTVDLNHNKGKNLKRKTNTVEEYIYFESPVVFKDGDGNSKYYTVELATEKIKDQADDLLDLYNVRLKASPVKNVKSTLNATDRMPSNTIISQSDSGVKSYQNANDPRGAYYKDIIYLFEKANASTFMHETAHWFKEELKKFGSEKSAMMLKKVDEWENEEFVKRYSVALDKGRYVVKNKVGGIVYDQAFQTAEDAKDYAKNELFARGFEAYLKEGKAPNSYLKNAFKSFWNWLRQLYRSAKTLNVELNDNIRGVYGNILGGMDLDFYLNAPTVQAIAQRQQREKDRASFIEQEIERAQELEKRKKRIPFANFRQERKESKKDGVKWWDQAAIPISTRAKRISPKLRNKLRGYDFNVLQEQKRQYELITPFYKKWQGMNENDIIAFDLALKNGHGDLQNRIVKKYGAEAEFKVVRDLLEEIYANAKTVGIDMGYQRDYFPREIADLDGLMEYLYSTEMVSELRRAQKEAGFRDMTDEERADFINKFLRGYQNKDLITPPPGNVKDRRIDVITAEINEFYKPSSQALFSYIDRMTNTIESRKFFGKDMEHVEESIGAFVDELIDNGEIKPTQDKEVEHILRARFKQKGVSNKFLIYQRNMSYIYTMGGINSAITQLSDLSVAMYKGGVWNTAKAIFGPKAPELTREGLGLEKIGQEFVDASTSSKAVEKIFKLTGLDKIDAFGKNILTQSVYIKFKDMAQNDPAKLKELIEPIMEQKTGETVNDLAEGKITPNVQLLVFNELADVQPITLSEMPEGYLAGGNWRIMYMLKTFMVKRIDTYRNECFDKIRSGQPEEVKKGLQNLFSLAMLIMLCGAAKDALIDLLYGRKIVLKEMVQNNALGLIGITKYQLYKAREDGWGGFISSFIPPAFGIWSDLGRDLSDDFLSAKGKDLKDYEVLKGTPILGRFYYWWFGGGRTKEEKKKKKKLK